MSDFIIPKIPQGCREESQYYGGLGRLLPQALKQKEAAEVCAAALTRTNTHGDSFTVVTKITNGSDGLPSYVPEYWYQVVKADKKKNQLPCP